MFCPGKSEGKPRYFGAVDDSGDATASSYGPVLPESVEARFP